MRTLLCSCLLLLATGALAQTQAASTPNGGVQKPEVPSVPSEAISPSQQNLCYTMRVYLFERNDGSSSLAGSKTCTPASQFRAIYIPTVMMRPHAESARAPVVRHCTPSGCTTVAEPKKPDPQR